MLYGLWWFNQIFIEVRVWISNYIRCLLTSPNSKPMLVYQRLVSIYICCLTSKGIPMLKIRRSHDRLILNMGIPIPGKDGLYIERGPWSLSVKGVPETNNLLLYAYTDEYKLNEHLYQRHIATFYRHLFNIDCKIKGFEYIMMHCFEYVNECRLCLWNIYMIMRRELLPIIACTSFNPLSLSRIFREK